MRILKIRPWKMFLPLLALGSFAFALFHVVRASQVPPEPPPPVMPPRSPFDARLAGAGILEAQTENIAVGSPLSGVVQEVCVQVGARVSRGQPLFRLDDRALLAERKVRLAAVEAAQAKLHRLRRLPRPEEVPPAVARVRELEAVVANELDLLRRVETLFRGRAASEEDYVRRKQAYEIAVQQRARAQADLHLLRAGAWKEEIAIAAAEVAQAEAQLAQVETELQRLVVPAPMDGEVLQLNVRPGEFVAAAVLERPALVLGNIRALHLRTDFAEYEIHRFHQDAAAYASPRGDPSRRFPLRFVRLEPFVVPKKSLTNDATERVDTRVLQVLYEVDPGTNRLFVGQLMDVFVEVPPQAGPPSSD